jgi:hypothetical protein
VIKKAIAFVFMAMASAVIAVAQPPSQDIQSPADWKRKHDMAIKYRNLGDFYAALKDAANKQPASLPDWTGIWTGDGGGRPTSPAPGGVSPKWTPVGLAELKKGQEMTAKGLVYDENLSQCGPAGHPRWLLEPFLREYIVTPAETWLITEQVNEIRRIYTDGRDHTPAADRYPLAEGDSIGFWDGQKLVIHTNQLRSASMGRNAPTQSEQMETVEMWEKVDANTILTDVWLFDPRLYTETWYFQRRYRRVPNPDKRIRINYWDCSENPNNDVVKTDDGDTARKGYTFIDKSKENHK